MFIPRALANIVDKIARQSVGKDWNLYAALLEHWQEIVGTEYARVTTPVKITFPHQPNEPRQRNGTLCVRLPKGLAMEFTYKTEQIRQRINGYFGYDAVAKIAFQPVYGAGPAPSAPTQTADPAALEEIRQTAKGIEDDDLRVALEAFGEAVAGYSNRHDPV
jgi:hypothetical protein